MWSEPYVSRTFFSVHWLAPPDIPSTFAFACRRGVRGGGLLGRGRGVVSILFSRDPATYKRLTGVVQIITPNTHDEEHHIGPDALRRTRKVGFIIIILSSQKVRKKRKIKQKSWERLFRDFRKIRRIFCIFFFTPWAFQQRDELARRALPFLSRGEGLKVLCAWRRRRGCHPCVVGRW